MQRRSQGRRTRASRTESTPHSIIDTNASSPTPHEHIGLLENASNCFNPTSEQRLAENIRNYLESTFPRLPAYMVQKLVGEQCRRCFKYLESKSLHVSPDDQHVCKVEICGTPLSQHSFTSTMTSSAIASFHQPSTSRVMPSSSLPPLPYETMPAAFDCPYCHRHQAITRNSSWTKHVQEDLEPYTCTFESCSKAPFKRKADWVRHENEGHRRLEGWACNVAGCAYRSYRRDNFASHLAREHRYPKRRIGRRSLASSGPSTASHTMIDLVVSQCYFRELPPTAQCVFCEESYTSREDWSKHVADHMMYFSLLVIAFAEHGTLDSANTIESLARNPLQIRSGLHSVRSTPNLRNRRRTNSRSHFAIPQYITPSISSGPSGALLDASRVPLPYDEFEPYPTQLWQQISRTSTGRRRGTATSRGHSVASPASQASSSQLYSNQTISPLREDSDTSLDQLQSATAHLEASRLRDINSSFLHPRPTPTATGHLSVSRASESAIFHPGQRYLRRHTFSAETDIAPSSARVPSPGSRTINTGNNFFDVPQNPQELRSDIENLTAYSESSYTNIPHEFFHTPYLEQTHTVPGAFGLHQPGPWSDGINMTTWPTTSSMAASSSSFVDPTAVPRTLSLPDASWQPIAWDTINDDNTNNELSGNLIFQSGSGSVPGNLPTDVSNQDMLGCLDSSTLPIWSHEGLTSTLSGFPGHSIAHTQSEWLHGNATTNTLNASSSHSDLITVSYFPSTTLPGETDGDGTIRSQVWQA